MSMTAFGIPPLWGTDCVTIIIILTLAPVKKSFLFTSFAEKVCETDDRREQPDLVQNKKKMNKSGNVLLMLTQRQTS